jgi:hypothetical protein
MGTDGVGGQAAEKPPPVFAFVQLHPQFLAKRVRVIGGNPHGR